MKNILIAGASGFVGRYLSKTFLMTDNLVTGIGTSKQHPFSEKYGSFKWISADTTCQGNWQEQVSKADIVINLAGRNIFNLWTKKYKESIYNSRILTTRHIADTLEKNKTSLFLNASAAGYYGDRKDEILTEDSSPGNDFLSKVSVDWENEALKADKKGVRTISMRFGIVLGNGGALSKMIPVFKRFAGGPLGSGMQWFPWIHIADLAQAVRFFIENETLSGSFNLTSSQSIRQKDFAKCLAKHLNRPCFMPAPAFAVKLIMGELGASLLASQRAVPDKLQKQGFEFKFDNLDLALENVIEQM